MHPLCGLQSVVLGTAGSATHAAVPLRRVHVNALVVDRVAQHTVTQTYVNVEPATIETKYVFPLPEGATVVDFSATFGDGRQIVGVVRERKEAQRIYQDAVDRAAHAALLEEERPDIFQASVGNLHTDEEVTVTLQYCLELPMEGDAVRLTIPSHVAPRFTPPGDESAQGSEFFCNFASGGVAAVGAAFSARVEVEMCAGGIEEIESPTHPAVTVRHAEEPGKATIDFKEAALDKDLVLSIKPKDLFKPVVAWEEWDEHGTQALMLSFVPKFELPMLDKVEATFIVDCSGSMSGARIAQARRAMQIFLRSLPEGCRFNIVKFGSSFTSMCSDASVPYSEHSLHAATSYVDHIGADMGGTMILGPLRFVLEKPPEEGYARQVFVLTDGQVSNEQQVIDFARGSGARIFTLGVGSGVSTFLVNGLSRVTYGHAAFVQDDERIEPVCISLLRKALTPSVSNLRIVWPSPPEDSFVFVEPATEEDPGDFGASTRAAPNLHASDTHQHAPQRPLPIFADANFCAFALYPSGGSNVMVGDVRITGDTPAGKLSLRLALPSVTTRRADPLVHRMAVRALIRELEEGDAKAMPVGNLDTARRLSLRFSVLCRSTAFVAVDERDGNERLAELVMPVVEARPGLRADCHFHSVSLQTAADQHMADCRFHSVVLQTADQQQMLRDLESACRSLREMSTTIACEVELQNCLLESIDCDSSHCYLREHRMDRQRTCVGHFGSVLVRAGRFITSIFSARRHEQWAGATGHTATRDVVAQSPVVDNACAKESSGSQYVPHTMEDVAKRQMEDVKLKTDEDSKRKLLDGEATKTKAEGAAKLQSDEKFKEKFRLADLKGPQECTPNIPRGASQMAMLERLLRLVTINGSFNQCEELYALLRISEETSAAWAREDWRADGVDCRPSGRVLVTALVLSYLRQGFPDEQETWDLVAAKSTAWLQTRSHEWKSDSFGDIEDLLAAAVRQLPSPLLSP